MNHIARLDKGCIGTAGSLGVDTEVAIGAGLSAKYLENGRIVYCYNGDGTHSRGNVHEAMNLAAIWKLPVLFICDDNQYAISANHANTIPVPNPAADPRRRLWHARQGWSRATIPWRSMRRPKS